MLFRKLIQNATFFLQIIQWNDLFSLQKQLLVFTQFENLLEREKKRVLVHNEERRKKLEAELPKRLFFLILPFSLATSGVPTSLYYYPKMWANSINPTLCSTNKMPTITAIPAKYTCT